MNGDTENTVSDLISSFITQTAKTTTTTTDPTQQLKLYLAMLRAYEKPLQPIPGLAITTPGPGMFGNIEWGNVFGAALRGLLHGYRERRRMKELEDLFKTETKAGRKEETKIATQQERIKYESPDPKDAIKIFSQDITALREAASFRTAGENLLNIMWQIRKNSLPVIKDAKNKKLKEAAEYTKIDNTAASYIANIQSLFPEGKDTSQILISLALDHANKIASQQTQEVESRLTEKIKLLENAKTWISKYADIDKKNNEEYKKAVLNQIDTMINVLEYTLSIAKTLPKAKL